MNHLSKKLPTFGRRSQYTRPRHDSSNDSDKAPKSDESEKAGRHQTDQTGNAERVQRSTVAASRPPTIPSALKKTQKPSASATARPDDALVANETVKLEADAARALPLKFEPVRKVLGLSVEQALKCFEGARGDFARTVVELMGPVGVNRDGQMQMDGQAAWNLMGLVVPAELRFKFIAALDANSLVALIRNMNAWRFHDHTSDHWMGPATNYQLAAMVAFDARYTGAFMDCLARARHAANSELGPIVDELGLLLAAAPTWTVGDLFKLLDKESRLPEFQANTAFLDHWKAAHENVVRAENKLAEKRLAEKRLAEKRLAEENDV